MLYNPHGRRKMGKLICKQTQSLTNKPMLCIETNKKFKSITDCSKEMKISKTSISNHLRGREGYEKVHGYTFAYIQPQNKNIKF